jgi:hypothetical protein
VIEEKGDGCCFVDCARVPLVLPVSTISSSAFADQLHSCMSTEYTDCTFCNYNNISSVCSGGLFIYLFPNCSLRAEELRYCLGPLMPIPGLDYLKSNFPYVVLFNLLGIAYSRVIDLDQRYNA